MTDTKNDNVTFKQFREEELKKYTIPDVENASDWQDERSILQRKAFVEYDIKQKWEKKLNG